MENSKKRFTIILSIILIAALMPFGGAGQLGDMPAAFAASDDELHMLLRGYNVLSGNELRNQNTVNLMSTNAAGVLKQKGVFEHIGATETIYESVGGTSMKSFAENKGISLNTEASAEVSIGKAFKASASAKFGMTNNKSLKNTYDNYYYQFLTTHRVGTNKIKDMESSKTLTAIREQVDEEVLQELIYGRNIDSIFQKYGTHFITQYEMGGWSEFNMTTATETADSSSSIEETYGAAASASGAYLAVTVGVNTSMDLKTKSEEEESSKKSTTKITSKVVGGGGGGVALDSTNANAMSSAINSWTQNFQVSNCEILTTKELKLTGIWELLPAGYETRKEQLKQEYIARSINQDKEFLNEFIYKATDQRDINVDAIETQSVTTKEFTPISSASQLANIGSGLAIDGNYKLTSDIDLTGTALGLKGKTFNGTFDGNGYTIRNYAPDYSSDTDVNESYVGLFDKIGSGGIVRNLNVESSTISCKKTVGTSVIGDIGGGIIAGFNSGTIENCHVVNSKADISLLSSLTTKYSHRVYAGGIAGFNEGKIVRCSYVNDSAENSIIAFSNNVLSNNANNDVWLYSGGIAGRVNANGTIEDSYSSGKVLSKSTVETLTINTNAKPYIYSGGIAGLSDIKPDSSTPRIKRCFSLATPSSTQSKTSSNTVYSGKLIGSNGQVNIMENCYYSTATDSDIPGIGNGDSNGAASVPYHINNTILNNGLGVGNGIGYAWEITGQTNPTPKKSMIADFYIVYKNNQSKLSFTEADIMDDDVSEYMNIYFNEEDVTNKVTLRYSFDQPKENSPIEIVYKNKNIAYISNINAKVAAFPFTKGTFPDPPLLQDSSPIVQVSSIKTHPKLYLVKGKSMTLTSSIAPVDAQNKEVTWSSSNPKVAVVDINGKVKGVKAGKATITVTSNNGKTAKCKVQVYSKAKKLKSVTITPSYNTGLVVGNTLTAKYTLNPNNATGVLPKFSSSNPSVASVDILGVVKALKPGKTKITVKAGSKSQSFTLSVVSKKVKVKGIKVKKTIKIKKGKTKKLSFTISPKKATNKMVTFKSSNKKVATVDQNGKIKAKKKGTTTITVTTKDGKKKAKCRVRVY